jgi:DNA-directed RNA polymerase subunit RPC12/RpoP
MKLFFSNFKKLILPMQLWLLSQGRCVGCGKKLVDSKESNNSLEQRVDCVCGRVYFFNEQTKTYRRALLNELQ